MTRDSSVSAGIPVDTVPAHSVMPKLPTWIAFGIALSIASLMPGGCTAKLEFMSLMRDRSVFLKFGW